MKKHILIIEDDKWLADSFQAVLVAAGYDVTSCNSAYEAMSLIEQKPPSLLIADILLGDHTSFMLLHELQSYSDTARIPVILCTSVDTQVLSRADTKAYGVVAVVDKATVTPQKLCSLADEHVGRPGRKLR